MSIEELRQKDGVRAFLREVERHNDQFDAVDKLHRAAFGGNIEEMQSLLEKVQDDENFDINEPHPVDGRSYLHSSVQGLPSFMIEYLFRSWEASVECRDNRGRTPILYAAMNGSSRIITRLIALGADLHAVDNDGLGALMLSAQGGHVGTMIFLHQAGLDVLKPANDGRTALHVAAFTGQTSDVSRECMVERLIHVGAKLDATTINRFVPLHYAAIGNQSSIIVKLYQLGSDLDVGDVNGLTPLMVASDQGNLSSVRVLVNLGANVGLVDDRGYSAMHFAAQKGRVQVVKFLFAHVPAIPSKPGRVTLGTHLRDIATWRTLSDATPMTLAAEHRHHDVVELFHMAMLFGQLPLMPEHVVVLQFEIYGIALDGGTIDAGRVKLMEYLKRIFGMRSCLLPMY